MMSRTRGLLPLLGASLLVVAGLAACGDSDPAGVAQESAGYSSTSQAPQPSVYPGGEEAPDEEAVAQVSLEDGSRVALWVDPEDWRVVWRQHSDPEDPTKWTEPATVFTAGEGCVSVYLATDGETVGANLACYEVDVFRQQAPDQSVGVATADLTAWEVSRPQEMVTQEPTVQDGTVVWETEGLRWSAGTGFEYS